MDGVMRFIDIDNVQVVGEPAIPDLFVAELADAIRRACYAPSVVFQAGVVVNREVVLALQMLKTILGSEPTVIGNVAIMGDRWFVAFTELPNAAPIVLPPLQIKPWSTETVPYTITTSPNTANPWVIRVKYSPWRDDPNWTYTTFSGTASSYYADGSAADPQPTQ